MDGWEKGKTNSQYIHLPLKMLTEILRFLDTRLHRVILSRLSLLPTCKQSRPYPVPSRLLYLISHPRPLSRYGRIPKTHKTISVKKQIFLNSPRNGSCAVIVPIWISIHGVVIPASICMHHAWIVEAGWAPAASVVRRCSKVSRTAMMTVGARAKIASMGALCAIVVVVVVVEMKVSVFRFGVVVVVGIIVEIFAVEVVMVVIRKQVIFVVVVVRVVRVTRVMVTMRVCLRWMKWWTWH